MELFDVISPWQQVSQLVVDIVRVGDENGVKFPRWGRRVAQQA